MFWKLSGLCRLFSRLFYALKSKPLCQAKKSGVHRSSVLDAKNNVNAYSESKFRRDALLGELMLFYFLEI